jgi:hypothetical protein
VSGEGDANFIHGGVGGSRPQRRLPCPNDGNRGR